ncbi:MAG: ATP-grasp domain-containing protein [Planctomycetota bacterium]|nr:ATP-grasp domain-containing protein [Planctomycetota bacterium]
MQNVIFVAPFALEATMRFLRPALALPGVKLALIGQEPVDRLPEDLRGKLAAHYRVDDAMEVDQLLAAVRHVARGWNGKVDRIIAILEQLQVPVAEVRAKLGLPGLSVEAALNFREKARMKNVLRANDLPCARHRLCSSDREAFAFGESSGFPIVVKPPAGAGAKNTFRVDSKEQLASWLKTSPIRAEQPLLLEEFIQGEEYSFDTVTIDGRHVFHSIGRYSPTPLDVLQNPWIQWVVYLPRRIDGPEFAGIRAAGPKALDALGMNTGLSHMEWFRRKDGSVAISEVGARPPGAQFTTLMSYAHDHDFYRAWIELMVFDTFTVPERKFSAGAAYLRGQGQGRVKSIRGLELAQKELGDLVVEAKLPQIGQTPKEGYEGEGYVVVRHPETEVVVNALNRMIEIVHVDLG